MSGLSICGKRGFHKKFCEIRVFCSLSKTSRKSDQIEAVKVHHLGPRRHKVFDEFLLSIVGCVNFGDRAEFRVRTEDQVNTRAGPFDFTGRAVRTFKLVFVLRSCFPGRSQIEQIDEEVVGQRFRAFGENAVFRPVVVGIKNAHTADKNRHLGRGQRQKLRFVNQHFLCRRFVMTFLVIAEAVSQRFEISERIHVGLFLRRIGASRSKRNGYIKTGIFRRFLDSGASAENDQIGKRNLFIAGKNYAVLRIVKFFLNAFVNI